MDVGKDLSVVADEGCVSSHAHVIFQVSGGIAVAVFNAEAEPSRLIGLERSGISFPDHPVTIGELRNFFICCELRSTGIVIAYRHRVDCKTVYSRQINLSYLGFRKAGLMHDVSKDPVVTRRENGQGLGEIRPADLLRMQVPEAGHIRHAYHEQVQDMAVVKDEIVETNLVGVAQI